METLAILLLALANVGWLVAIGYASSWSLKVADLPVMGGLILTFTLDAGVLAAIALF